MHTIIEKRLEVMTIELSKSLKDAQQLNQQLQNSQKETKCEMQTQIENLKAAHESKLQEIDEKMRRKLDMKTKEINTMQTELNATRSSNRSLEQQLEQICLDLRFNSRFD